MLKDSPTDYVVSSSLHPSSRIYGLFMVDLISAGCIREKDR